MNDVKTTNVNACDNLRHNTNIINEEAYRNRLLAIMEVASEMVQKTLGPYGATTIVDDGLFTYPTKDGWTVLKNLRFRDGVANAIYTSIKQVSFNLANTVGDGTTSSFVGAHLFMMELLKVMNGKSFRQKDFLDALHEVMEEIEKELSSERYTHKINPDGDFEDIEKIAYIASNGNAELAGIIRQIYQETKNPNIYVKYDPSRTLRYEIQKGYKLDCKPIRQEVYRNSDDGTFTLKEPAMVAIFDHNVTFSDHGIIITALSRYASQKNTTLFIFSPHFDNVISQIIGSNIDRMLQNNQVPNIMLIQVPLSTESHKKYLSDLVLLTNAQVFDGGKVRAFNTLVHNQTAKEEDKINDPLLDADGFNFTSPEDIIEKVVGKTLEMAVSAKHIMVSRFTEVVNPVVYNNTLNEIKDEYLELKRKAENSSSMLQKDYMDAYQHYTKFFGNMGVILVGGTSELEKHCLKDAVDDATLACRSAFDHGYVRGLNLAMIEAIGRVRRTLAIEMAHTEWDDTVTSYKGYALDILEKTFTEMSRRVIENKYPNTSEIRYQLPYPMEETVETGSVYDLISFAVEHSMGFDLETDRLYNDGDCPVINSTRTDIEVLKGMISIASMLLTSNQLLTINQIFDIEVSQKQRDKEEIQKISAIAEAVTKKVLREVDLHCKVSDSNGDGFFERLFRKWRKGD